MNHEDVTRGAACHQFLLSAGFSHNAPFSLHVSCLIIAVTFSSTGRRLLDCATDPEPLQTSLGPTFPSPVRALLRLPRCSAASAGQGLSLPTSVCHV